MRLRWKVGEVVREEGCGGWSQNDREVGLRIKSADEEESLLRAHVAGDGEAPGREGFCHRGDKEMIEVTSSKSVKRRDEAEEEEAKIEKVDKEED